MFTFKENNVRFFKVIAFQLLQKHQFTANETNLSDNINQNTDIFIIFNYSVIFTMRSAHLPQLIQP